MIPAIVIGIRDAIACPVGAVEGKADLIWVVEENMACSDAAIQKADRSASPDIRQVEIGIADDAGAAVIDIVLVITIGGRGRFGQFRLDVEDVVALGQGADLACRQGHEQRIGKPEPLKNVGVMRGA